MKQTQTGEICPMCGGNLENKKGKYGYFVGCSSFPHCRYIRKEESSLSPIEQQTRAFLARRGELKKDFEL